MNNWCCGDLLSTVDEDKIVRTFRVLDRIRSLKEQEPDILIIQEKQ